MGMNLAFAFAYLRSKEQICLQGEGSDDINLTFIDCHKLSFANKHLDYSGYQTEDTELEAGSSIIAIFSVLLKVHCFLHTGRSILNSQELFF